MVAPHLRNKAEKAVSNDRPDADVMRDTTAPRLGGSQPPAIPLPASDSSTFSPLTAETLPTAIPDPANAPMAAPVASHYTDQELAAGRKKLRYKVEHPKDGQKGLSRQAAWRQYPCLYIDVPRNEQGVPLPSPVLEGHDTDQTMTDAPDPGPDSALHGAPGTGSTDAFASNTLPPPALPLHGAQVPPSPRAAAISPKPSSPNATAAGSRVYTEEDILLLTIFHGETILATTKRRNLSLEQSVAFLRGLAAILLRDAQSMEEYNEGGRK